MIGSSSSNFADIVTIGERIENEVKSGKIAGTVSQPVVNKKPYGSFLKKKESEISVVTTNVHPQYQIPMDLMSYYHYPYIVASHYQQPFFQYQPHNHNQQPTPTQPAQTQQNAHDNKGQGQGQN